ncbi:MAG: molybdenum cofactor guanylyltransferase MobA [Gemmatimonadaceae bacterium]
MRTRCVGAILAGGQATRYGGLAKGTERVGGTRIVDRVAASLRAACDDMLIVADQNEAATWLPDVRRVRDVRPGNGSLGGIHAALVAAGCPVLLIAWDMPFVPTTLMQRLRTLGESGVDVALPVSGSRRGVEPMCAYYAPSCVAPIEHCLDAGDRRIIAFFDAVSVARLEPTEVAGFGDPEVMFMNVNSPDDLTRAEGYATSTDDRHRRPKA